MLDFLKNNFLYGDKYKTNSEAVVIAPFFNPQQSPYRTEAFNVFYNSIKHLNHRIVEGVIGDAQPELPPGPNVDHVRTQNLLWHKEALLNKTIRELPAKYKYVFWVDADVIFDNKDWLVDGVDQLKENNIIQPFEYCVHLDRDERKPSFPMAPLHRTQLPNLMNNKVWRSFAANYATSHLAHSPDYNMHGHVGFAWGARREVLDAVPLYDRALIGGADHIIAHAAVGQIGHSCITKSFTEDIDAVNAWSRQFYGVAQGKMNYVEGDLYHIWHGDVEKRDYYNRIRRFTPMSKNITQKDGNGLYLADDESEDFMRRYFAGREVTEVIKDNSADIAPVVLADSDLLLDTSSNNAGSASDAAVQENFAGFGGGESGGGGATSSWGDDTLTLPEAYNVPGQPNYTPFS